MSKKLIDYISAQLPGNKELLEKDIILHRLLVTLTEDQFFRHHFVFKGGTCLTKCYLGYYRFSEDLDFTWVSQANFSEKSQKEIRRLLSVHIDRVLELLLKFSQRWGLDFKREKKNGQYLEFGGSNKFVTFKLWYISQVSERKQFLKVQINFVEVFFFPFQERKAKWIGDGLDKEILFLFPEAELLFQRPTLSCYSLEEILVEKYRAILTRRSLKARDFIDIFVISQKIDVFQYRAEIVAKIRFMLQYDKYMQNLRNHNLKKLVVGQESALLLQPLPEGYSLFITKIQPYLLASLEELTPS